MLHLSKLLWTVRRQTIMCENDAKCQILVKNRMIRIYSRQRRFQLYYIVVTANEERRIIKKHLIAKWTLVYSNSSSSVFFGGFSTMNSLGEKNIDDHEVMHTRFLLLTMDRMDRTFLHLLDPIHHSTFPRIPTARWCPTKTIMWPALSP